MTDLEAVLVVEGAAPADFDTQTRAWQHLIDAGLAWRLQGWYGRTAANLIRRGVCTPTGHQPTTPSSTKKEITQ